MAGSTLVRPLEDDWRDTLDGIARTRSWPTTHDATRLGARVVALSAAYNDPTRARAPMREAGPARLGFSFARDVPKGAAAVRELVATGTLTLQRPLRVLDVGAGLGATTWGLARALDAAGHRGTIEATWLDSDADALDLGASIHRARGGRQGGVTIGLRTRVGGYGATSALGRFDVVLVGQVLSELDVTMPDAERCRRHAEFLRGLLDEHTQSEGALVVIEPALRDRSRHLHRVRDVLGSDSPTPNVTIFAPCLHTQPCPALARDSDWCHEDLAVDLPGWLVPVARAAGLRREGLTFSYLVLRRGNYRLVDAIVAPRGATRLRIVSDAIRTKGKREVFVCGELGGTAGPLVARARLMRLDRDERPANGALAQLSRGDVAIVAPIPDFDRPRIGAAGAVELGIPSKRSPSPPDHGESR